jgi:hypothetical protein
VSIKTNSLLLALFLSVPAAFAVDPIASFAKQSLGLDLEKISFKTTTSTDYGATAAPLTIAPLVAEGGTIWQTNAASGKYSQDYPSRTLRYAFREDRLVAIRVSMNSMVINGRALFGTKEFEDLRKELVQIQDELMKARKVQKQNSETAKYHIQYATQCGPSPDSLFLMEIEFTPVEAKKSS